MTKICRTCLQEFSCNSTFYYLDMMDSKTKKITIHRQLTDFIPELDLDIAPNSVICEKCFESLTVAQEFKNKCLKTESKIQKYIEQMNYLVTSVNLKEIATLNEKLPPCNDTINSQRSSQTINEPLAYNNEKKFNNEGNIDLTNLQCDTKNIFAIPKIAELLKSENFSIKCCYCNFEASTYFDLNNHKQLLHQDLLEIEVKHSKEQKFNINLTNFKNEQEKRYKCTKCDFTSIYNSALNKHVKLHLYDKLFKCDTCNYKTRLKFDLKRHLKTHSNEKHYKCVICNYKSSRKTHLLQHMNIHKTYKCKFCDCKLSENQSGVRPNKCLPINSNENSYLHSFFSYISSANKTDIGLKNSVEVGMSLNSSERPTKLK